MISKTDLMGRIGDPRDNRYSENYDPAYREETLRLYKAAYPEPRRTTMSAADRNMIAARRDNARNDRNSTHYDLRFAEETLLLIKAATRYS